MHKYFRKGFRSKNKKFNLQIFLIIVTLILMSFNAPIIASQLPTPLSKFDVDQYRRLLDLQKSGNMKQAIREMGRVKNPILKGHVLAQRYLHPTAWRSSYKELSEWLAHYNDHPDASRIYWLAKRRKPKKVKNPTSPKPNYLNGFGQAGTYGYVPRIPASNRGRASPSKTASVANKVRRAIRRGWPTGALDVLNRPGNRRYLTGYEEGQLRGEVSHAYFVFGVDDKAIRQARYAIANGHENAGMAYWAGGLAAWRSGQIELAGKFFRSLTELSNIKPGQRSAAAFWAYRVEIRMGRPRESMRYLGIAAREVDSFYGVIARHALGQDFRISFDLPEISKDFYRWLNKQKGGKRLFALLQLGEINAAERELRYLWTEMPEMHRLGLMRFSSENGMAGLSFRIAEIFRKDTGIVWYGALYPQPQFQFEHKIDEALIWAISRQESGFNPRAKSRAKASGLMQLMPSTASFIARDRRYRDRKRHELFEPKVNLHLAEKYIQHLLKEPVVNKSLVRMLMAYNAGPGNLKKWLSKVDHQNDPFLLVESIPARETRFYVKNVISNLAMYRKKFKENSPAIAGLVSGNGGIFNLNEAKKLFQ